MDVRHRWIASSLLVGVLATAWPAMAAGSAEPPLYTAQRKPRVAVMVFGDTNSSADIARFGPAVSAMLVTFLKRNGHFVVVERQDLEELLAEWDRIQGGKTNLSLEGDAELLERIDVILQGEVTLLEGRRIEVDARLLSRTDGRIITAAQRSGPEGCLRQVVARLGTALEEDFLRPYYGKLQINFEDPENTRIHLTPVLRTDALDEEKPPVELGFTVYAGEDKDRREQWITSPRTYTIENILSGWYTLRLERPGYMEARTDAEAYRAVVAGGETRICYWTEEQGCVPVAQVGPDAERYLVHVEPGGPTLLDATALGFELRKEGGEIRVVAVDETGHPLPDARLYLRSLDLRLNPGSPDPAVHRHWPEASMRAAAGNGKDPSESEDGVREASDGPSGSPGEEVETRGATPPREPAGVEREEATCDFVEEITPSVVDYGEQWVRRTTEYDFASFKGGLLAFENYQGEELPTGRYELVVWAPFRRPVHQVVNVAADEVSVRASQIRLERWSRGVKVLGQTSKDIRVVAQSTGVTSELSVAGNHGDAHFRLPVDRYVATLNADDETGWKRSLDLYPQPSGPPLLEEFLAVPPLSSEWFTLELPDVPLKVKVGLWVGGRIESFLVTPGVHEDSFSGALLDSILTVSESRRRRRSLEGKESDLDRLGEGLEDIDLLILSDADMSALRVLPSVSAVIREWVEEGHALMSFVTERGDYSEVLGAPLEIAGGGSSNRFLRLHTGKVLGFTVDEKIDLGRPRRLPRLKHRRRALRAWKVLSFEKKRRRPRVLERTVGSRNGYMMVWLDSAGLEVSHPSTESLDRSWIARLGAVFGKRPEEPQEILARECGSSLRPRMQRALLEAARKTQEAEDRVLIARARFKNRAVRMAEELLRQRWFLAETGCAPSEGASRGQQGK